MSDSANFAGIDQKLSQDLRLSLTADKEALFTIMQEHTGDALVAALRNPELDENHIKVLLKRRGLPDSLFNAIYASKRLIENYAVKFALVCHPEAPSHISLTLLPHLYLFDLLKICFMPGTTPDQRVAAERTIVQRLPTEPLGNKLTLARRGTAAVVEILLREGQPQVVEACLDNPHLKEGAVYQLLTSGTATAETISAVARSCRWKGRPNIKLAILKHPRTPAIWYTVLLPGLAHHVLRDLLASPRLTMAQKDLVRQALGSKGR